jgi:hypothetical protein
MKAMRSSRSSLSSLFQGGFCFFFAGSVAATETDVVGWKEFRFGMSREQVEQLAPDGELHESGCNAPASVQPKFDCRKYTVENRKIGDLYWGVVFEFSRVDQTLQRIRLTPQEKKDRRKDVFQQALDAIRTKYVFLKTQENEVTKEDFAQDCEDRLDDFQLGKPMRFLDFVRPMAGSSQFAGQTPSAIIIARYNKYYLCSNTPPAFIKQAEEHLDGDLSQIDYRVEIEYRRQGKLATEDF